MTAGILEAVDVTVQESQVRIRQADAVAALQLVRGRPAVAARARLRFGPGVTYEPIARLLDAALARAEQRGLDPDVLVVAAGQVAPGEDIVRIRRKAHGVADWIASPTSAVTVVLRPRGLAAVAEAETSSPVALPTVPGPAAPPSPETAAELRIREALYDVIDPDLGVNVVDLGFVRRVRIGDDGVATLTMTLTSAACPLTGVMERHIGAVLAELGVAFVVDWQWLPCWRPDDISPDGREQLRAIGFNAF